MAEVGDDCYYYFYSTCIKVNIAQFIMACIYKVVMSSCNSLISEMVAGIESPPPFFFVGCETTRNLRCLCNVCFILRISPSLLVLYYSFLLRFMMQTF